MIAYNVRIKTRIFYFLFPAILMVSSWEARAQCFAGAANFTTNTTGNDWSVGTHWSGGVSPGCDINVVNRKVEVRSNTTVFSATCPTLSMSAANTSLHVTNNSTLTIQGAFSPSGEFVCIYVEMGSTLIVQGNFTLNSASASITVAGSMQVVGNFIIANELATINVSGSLSVNSTLSYSGSNNTLTNSGTTTISTTLQAGALTVGNSLVNASTGIVNVGAIDLDNGDFIINNSGTINQSGNFIDIDAGSGFNNLATGTWKWSLTPNPTYDVSVNTILNCSAIGNTFNYNGAGVQWIIPVSYQNLSLSNSGAKFANNVSFSVGGNWLVSGTATFTEGTATITLNGTGAQTITNPAEETFNNLVINNNSATSPQITLNNPVTITTTLTMTDGNVNLNGNLFTISSAASGALSHSLLSTAGWMYGGSIIRSFSNSPAIAVGNVAGFFPLGGSLNFRPFFIGKSSIVGSDGTITISHTDAITATNVSFTDNTIPASAGTVSIQRRHNSFWTVAKSAGISEGTFDLRAGGTGFNIGAIGDVRLTRVSNTTDIGTAVATTGTAADVRANRTGINIATGGVLNTNFYIASTNAVASLLPIVLAYYRVRLQGDEVISSWKTLQEKNNHFFTVQKIVDFESFYDVGRLEGKGNSQEEHAYSFIDDSPFFGKSYYRLKQTDFDGKFTFSDPVMINYQGSSTVLKAYPNPFSGKQITLELKGLKDCPSVPIQIYNQQGQKVMDLILHENGPGIIKEEIIFPVNLPQGLYIIKAGKTLQLTRKIIVN